MTSEFSTERRAALLMLRKHGATAQTRALALAKERSSQGDMTGWSLWFRVYKAIDVLRYQAGTPLSTR